MVGSLILLERKNFGDNDFLLGLPSQPNSSKRDFKKSRSYPAKTITDAYYADDIAILENTPNQHETLLHSLERAAAGIGLHVNARKTEYMCYNQTGDISTQDGTSLKTGRQIQLPRKHCRINRKRHRHTANEGMESYR